MVKLAAWNIKQLHEALQQDLAKCNSDFERSMVRIIGGKEIREKAKEFRQERKLTPIEEAILAQY